MLQYCLSFSDNVYIAEVPSDCFLFYRNWIGTLNTLAIHDTLGEKLPE